jgi:transposase
VHIRTVRNSKGQGYYQLVESFRQNGQVKKRILLSLGKVEDHKIDQLSQAIARHCHQLTAIKSSKSIDVKQTFILGPLLVIEGLFKRLGINAVLEEIQQQHPKLGFNLTSHIFSLVACRFICPSSKLKVYDHLLDRVYPKMIQKDIQLHTLYRSISLLAKHKDHIEGGLYRHGRDLLNMQLDVVLYDLTTLRFESTRTDLGQLRQFGYSKEMRSDCTQVVLGLLVDTDGIPLGFEVYAGNTFEGKTLKDIIQKMRKKFQVRRFIFVADRGLFSEENLNCIRQESGEFIVGLRLGVFKQRHEEFYDLSRFRALNDSLYLYETKHKGDRAIISWSRSRHERDQQIRADIIEKILKKLQNPKTKTESFISHKGWRRYIRLNGQSQPVLDESAIREDEKKDGFFGILTNVKDLSGEAVVMQYKDLWKVEDAFGELKGPTLRARPAFHWSDERIIGHLCLCFLSYLCEAHLTKLLRQKAMILTSHSIEEEIIRDRPLTVASAMRELCEVRAIPVQLGDTKTIWVRTDINGNAAKLFTAAGIKQPSKILDYQEKCSATNRPKPCLSDGNS